MIPRLANRIIKGDKTRCMRCSDCPRVEARYQLQELAVRNLLIRQNSHRSNHRYINRHDY